MDSRKLLVIVCVTAGKQQRVVRDIRSYLKGRNAEHKIVAVTSPPGVAKAIRRIDLTRYKAAAVYGGDGTVVAAIKAFEKTSLPVLILPGGTANVLAGYYNMPSTPEGCLDLYLENKFVHEYIDIATIDDEPLVLDMHFGLWTKAIQSTSRSLKKHIGEAAYAWSTIRQAVHAKPRLYRLTIDSQVEHVVHGYTMLIANQGNHSILGVPLFPRDHAPGLLQVAIVKSLRVRDLLIWYFARLLGGNRQDIIEIYRARELNIKKAPTSMLWDDVSREVTLPISVTGGELSAKLLIPPTQPQIHPLKKMIRVFGLLFHRAGQRLRTFVYGAPSVRYSHVAPKLYVGGKYTPRDYKRFQSWGITGVVSMRTHASPPAPEGIELLRLPTTDWHPPAIEDLKKGTEFMERHIQNDGAVYVHCRQGEGRGPTMAAAYLISKGFSVDEALKQLSKYRPVARPNARQRKRLAEWQELCNQS